MLSHPPQSVTEYGDMDIATCRYMCLTPGYYTVVFSGTVVLDVGEIAELFLHHNSKVVQESHWISYNANLGRVWDQGSRNLGNQNYSDLHTYQLCVQIYSSPAAHLPNTVQRSRDWLTRILCHSFRIWILLNVWRVTFLCYQHIVAITENLFNIHHELLYNCNNLCKVDIYEKR